MVEPSEGILSGQKTMLPLLPRKLPPTLQALTALALDLRWTFSHAAERVWRTLDPDSWESTRNPWFTLQDAPQRRLEELAANPSFSSEVERLCSAHQEYMVGPTWFAANGTRLSSDRIAYFSMEFGLGEALPLYAGGLGILAGDFLKTASDLGLPLVGVGILFQEGYFRQTLDAGGAQHQSYPYNDPLTLPIQPVDAKSGDWLRVPVYLPGRTLWLRIWRARVGRVDLLLLDGNDPLNTAPDRGITAQLYGGGTETRLLQEIVLGIGGWRALAALGFEPTIAHLNEGHAAFVILERARRFMQAENVSFHEALWATRAGNVFTTHTPVAAGFDEFSPDLMEKHFPPFGRYLTQLGISQGELLALGRRPSSEDPREPFNMARLAMQGCARTNAVSRLHGEVSQRLFTDLFPRWPEREVPVEYVTNGVHVPTWHSEQADVLWTTACGDGGWHGPVGRLSGPIAAVSDEELWKTRGEGRSELVSHARRSLERQLAQRGHHPTTAAAAGNILAPDVLTIGFARRFAEYKRPDLLLRRADRLVRLLNDTARPVQILVAGKAHPADEAGKRLITQWFAFVNRPEVRQRAVFLEDYDMTLAKRLVTGVDVWINTPRRPWEASGTSGMKVLANGGLNLSELDGWWAEAYTPDVGWALGQNTQTPSDEQDVEDLYALLEQHIVPEFYDRDDQGLPRRWLARIRASMATLAPAFSSNRMVLEYVERIYGDAAEALHRRADGGARVAKDLNAWQERLESHWGEIRVEGHEAKATDGGVEFRVTVRLGAVAPGDVSVEIFADATGEKSVFRQLMKHVSDPSGPTNLSVFVAEVATSRPAADFTPRVIPYHPEVRVPAELPLITWSG
jgi:glycogen phosphorylase